MSYSSRAAGALLCVAQGSGSQPGVYMAFHSALFAPENQPEENGSSDPSNQQLADLATSVGRPSVGHLHRAGQQTAAAATAATAFIATLNEVTGGRGADSDRGQGRRSGVADDRLADQAGELSEGGAGRLGDRANRLYRPVGRLGPAAVP